jgi:hypothetical protein
MIPFIWTIPTREVYRDKKIDQQFPRAGGRRWGDGVKDAVWFWVRKILELIAVMAVQLCEHTKTHLIVHFKWRKCMWIISIKLLYIPHSLKKGPSQRKCIPVIPALDWLRQEELGQLGLHSETLSQKKRKKNPS